MKIFSLFIALGFLVLETGSLCADDIYVAITGNDTSGNGSLATPYRTLQRAANTAGTGDNVNIRVGTYLETVRAAKSITLDRTFTPDCFLDESPQSRRVTMLENSGVPES